MPATVFIIDCVILVSLFFMVLLGIYVLGKRNSGQQPGRRQIEVISLHEGETLYGVMDKGTTHHFFVGRYTSHEKGYE
jgi:hypothetical protein